MKEGRFNDVYFSEVNMSKSRENINKIDGEFTGMSRLSYDCYISVVEFCKNLKSIFENMHYEEAFVAISRKEKIFVKCIEDLIWCEIDFMSQLVRARDEVIPMIMEEDNSAIVF